ncbi:hypothetical protein [Paenibacillus sp. BIC5C1]|uniref:hypothetical protein n=1 Tax=Paenibacillus sp. BIC5C1 TaxID=3078263 RepID=UPI0028E721C1|nr:hypothetical protein [Paenibacillus sp. BIC5C1]
MLSYGELLRQYIDNSELSLSQIESKLREKGLATNKAYISKLQNGKLPPAGDEINKALAEVLNGDEEELILSSYAERAPFLKSIIDKLFESFTTMLLSNKELIVAMMQPIHNNENELLENYEDIIVQVMSNMSLKEKTEMISSLSEYMARGGLAEYTKFQDGILEINPISFLSDEKDQAKYREVYDLGKRESIANLTKDELFFLTKQLELYRSLNLSDLQKSDG